MNRPTIGSDAEAGNLQQGLHTLPDTLNARIGVLTRREVEARLLGPLIAALGERFGLTEVLEVVRDTVVEIAREQGRALAESAGQNGMAEFADSMRDWTVDDALRMDVIELSDEAFSFNVTRCRYAELYQSLGLAELGAVLSCNRDAALIEGFNPAITLERTQTMMQGAPCCDFRYRRAGASGQ